MFEHSIGKIESDCSLEPLLSISDSACMHSSSLEPVILMARPDMATNAGLQGVRPSSHDDTPFGVMNSGDVYCAELSDATG